jgi:hypothetical protein
MSPFGSKRKSDSQVHRQRCIGEATALAGLRMIGHSQVLHAVEGND